METHGTFQIEKKLLSVLQKITGNSYNEVDLTQSLSKQIHLDSLQAVDFFTAVEMEYNIELPLTMMTMKDLNSFVNVLKKEIHETEMIN